MAEEIDPKSARLKQSWNRFKNKVINIKSRTRKLISDAETAKNAKIVDELNKKISGF